MSFYDQLERKSSDRKQNLYFICMCLIQEHKITPEIKVKLFFSPEIEITRTFYRGQLTLEKYQYYNNV